MRKSNDSSPWVWIPTLYFVEGVPYFVVNTISLIMFKDMGMNNGTLALLTSLLSIPWVVKPFWSPFVDILWTKRRWIVSMQILMAAALAMVAICVPRDGNSVFTTCLIFFVITAFASATHDIAADGYYMIELDSHRQSAFVGLRSTFYRCASVFGQGVLVVFAGAMEKRLADVPLAWTLTLLLSAALLALTSVYHLFLLPHPADDTSHSDVRGIEILKGFGYAFSSFFRKRGVWTAVLFMLLYRLPEAFSVKMLFPFFKDPPESGGLGMDTETFGLIYGTFGVIALLVGGILGGLAASRRGLRSCLWPMALSLTLPCSVYLVLAVFQPQSVVFTAACVILDQFGYGFGFSANMLFMMYFSDGPLKTSHYAVCTAFMALSMMLPGLVAGFLQESLGYMGFFTLVMLCCLVTFAVTHRARKIVDGSYALDCKS